MNRKTLPNVLLASALALGAGVPTLAIAQQQQVGQASFGNLISALNNINAQLRALENVNVEDVDIRVVNVEDVLRGANVEALNNALNRNNVEILNLRNVLNGNQVLNDSLNDVLRDADIDVTVPVFIQDVVAIEVLKTGDVVLFYDGR